MMMTKGFFGTIFFLYFPPKVGGYLCVSNSLCVKRDTPQELILNRASGCDAKAVLNGYQTPHTWWKPIAGTGERRDASYIDGVNRWISRVIQRASFFPLLLRSPRDSFHCYLFDKCRNAQFLIQQHREEEEEEEMLRWRCIWRSIFGWFQGRFIL